MFAVRATARTVRQRGLGIARLRVLAVEERDRESPLQDESLVLDSSGANLTAASQLDTFLS